MEVTPPPKKIKLTIALTKLNKVRVPNLGILYISTTSSVVNTMFLSMIEMGLGPPPASAIIKVTTLVEAAKTPITTNS